MSSGKQYIIEKLIESNAYWSYEVNQDTNIPDDSIIENALLHLDIDDIDLLFNIYPYGQIKQVWESRILKQLPRYKNLNKFLSWFYFNE